MNIYEMMKSGGPVMWPLLACSIVVVTVIAERALFWIQVKKKQNHALRGDLLRLAEGGDWRGVAQKSGASTDYVVRMLNAGVLHRRSDMGKAMEAEAQPVVKRMLQFMSVLDTMITVGPLLGIFGTVLGIISSFKILSVGGIADPKLVSSGIAQALITTAAGLAISIVTVFPYNYFKGCIEDAVYNMENHASRLEVIEKQAEQKNGLSEKGAAGP